MSTTFSSTPTSLAATSWRALPRSASWLNRAFSAAFACPLSSQRAPAAASLDRRSCSAASRTRACFSRCASASFPRSSSLSTHAGSCASVYCRCMSSANTCQQPCLSSHPQLDICPGRTWAAASACIARASVFQEHGLQLRQHLLEQRITNVACRRRHAGRAAPSPIPARFLRTHKRRCVARVDRQRLGLTSEVHDCQLAHKLFT